MFSRRLEGSNGRAVFGSRGRYLTILMNHSTQRNHYPHRSFHGKACQTKAIAQNDSIIQGPHEVGREVYRSPGQAPAISALDIHTKRV